MAGLTEHTAREPSAYDAARSVLDRLPVQAVIYASIGIVLAASGLGSFWDVFSLMPGQVSPWWTLATALPAAALILIKRRWPIVGLGVAWVIMVADLATFGGVVPLIVFLEFVHVTVIGLPRAQRRRVLLALVIYAVALTLVALQQSGSVRMTILVALQMGALFGFTYWYANSAAQSEELLGLYRQRAADAALLASRDRADAVRAERVRMAGELHDIVAGHVAAVAIRSEAALASGALAGTSPDDTPSVEHRALRAARDASLEAHAALRSMIAVLRDGAEAEVASVDLSGLAGLVDAGREAGLEVSLHDRIPPELSSRIDPASSAAAGRVVQEALANCMKHAAGGEVVIEAVADRDALTITVRSRGGAALAALDAGSPGMGLHLLGERVGLLGGTCSAGPDGDGWLVRAELPATVTVVESERRA